MFDVWRNADGEVDLSSDRRLPGQSSPVVRTPGGVTLDLLLLWDAVWECDSLIGFAS